MGTCGGLPPLVDQLSLAHLGHSGQQPSSQPQHPRTRTVKSSQPWQARYVEATASQSIDRSVNQENPSIQPFSSEHIRLSDEEETWHPITQWGPTVEQTGMYLYLQAINHNHPSDTPGTRLESKDAACNAQRYDCPLRRRKDSWVASGRGGNSVVSGERALYRGLDWTWVLG
ncbi:hypothetical protein P168DRAFT_140057 [Aspergillus campestris IBT 28561]|uniref:Uncharacterized protein n=1 Tax=Aspergillus campestris (strain IBT 28561) TaxID=1392248 RepID=A0A2I1D4P1_ASPC2|nr:uncharacterized protein P168DRAFT_140057 [Aspergillus campestris IBT 28561]PKY04830.1 hypothetical protein P168DRAFT_140057 [Aspergillus campestris IBT 28561]